MGDKRILSAVLVCFGIGLLVAGCAPAFAQQADQGGIEPGAGKWATWVLNSGSQITLPAPPDQAATAAELSNLKAQSATRDTAVLDQIAYWNTGWPGYRWQEIALALSAKDPSVYLWRTMALVSVASHDATTAAWDTKYRFDRPHPSEVDPTLKPAVAVPRSPSYPSEHAAVAAAVAGVLT